MKDCRLFLLILIILFAKNVCGQTLFIKELAEAKKLPPSTKKDSLIVDLLFRNIQLNSVNEKYWLDSLIYYSKFKKNRTAYLLTNFLGKDITLSQNELLSIANEFEKKQNLNYASWIYLRIGIGYTNFFTNKREQAKALQYYEKALKLAKSSGSDIEIVRAYDYIGEHFIGVEDFRNGITYLEKAREYAISEKSKSILPTIYTFLASGYLNMNNIILSKRYYKLCENSLLNPKYDFHPSYKLYIRYIFLNNISKYYLKTRNYNASVKYALKGLTYADEIIKQSGARADFISYKIKLMENLQAAYFNKGDLENAYFYLKNLEQIKNTNNNNIQIKDFKELNLKYQAEQNKLKITALENEKLKNDIEKQSTLKYFVAVLISLLFVIIGSVFYSNRKLKIKNKEISEALLKGQTVERKRVAADLHDNLGSTLSALWLSVDMIDKSKMNEEESAIHQNLRENLEKAYNDVRLLSHNLLPEELEKQGLSAALQYFVRKINQNSSIKFDLQIDETLGKLDKKIEFELYSICLELVNNIIKHSKATEAMLRLRSATNGKIQLTVEDNGIGIFENNSDGKGMKNVQARVESLNGVWNIKSKENKGTNSQITIPV